RAFFFGMARVLGMGGVLFFTPISLLVTIYAASLFANEARYGSYFSNFLGYPNWIFCIYFVLPWAVLWVVAALVQRLAPNFTAGLQPGPM
ncbi:hypothetical protein Q5762_38500, partial [Streptomyces sp. P9(2023)]|uniref:hypothetical protein n=1 Tax=Streptomyces sp. P9(2023) TaxID=3064394 RepID=UPI0028F443BC